MFSLEFNLTSKSTEPSIKNAGKKIEKPKYVHPWVVPKYLFV